MHGYIVSRKYVVSAMRTGIGSGRSGVPHILEIKATSTEDAVSQYNRYCKRQGYEVVSITSVEVQ